MSEKIYAWLLRLYPSSFQEAYRDEALQLFRDRMRDETGFFFRLRLWLDLLTDLAISVPRGYRAVPPTLVASPAQRSANGSPSFHILEDESLSLGSLVYGGIASLVVYGSLLFLISHVKNSFPIVLDAQPAVGYSGSVAKPTPKVTLTWLPAKPAPGATIRLTATVHAIESGPIPTGHVRFFDGSTILDTAKLDNGSITVKGKLPHSTTHSIHAIYYGDMNYHPAGSIDQQETR